MAENRGRCLPVEMPHMAMQNVQKCHVTRPRREEVVVGRGGGEGRGKGEGEEKAEAAGPSPTLSLQSSSPPPAQHLSQMP